MDNTLNKSNLKRKSLRLKLQQFGFQRPINSVHLSEWSLKCKTCGLRFNKASELNIHECWVHSNHKPKISSSSGKCFITLHRLNPHKPTIKKHFGFFKKIF